MNLTEVVKEANADAREAAEERRSRRKRDPWIQAADAYFDQHLKLADGLGSPKSADLAPFAGYAWAEECPTHGPVEWIPKAAGKKPGDCMGILEICPRCGVARSYSEVLVARDDGTRSASKRRVMAASGSFDRIGFFLATLDRAGVTMPEFRAWRAYMRRPDGAVVNAIGELIPWGFREVAAWLAVHEPTVAAWSRSSVHRLVGSARRKVAELLRVKAFTQEAA